VIAREKLPDDAADWADVTVAFPRLTRDAPSSCPCSSEEVFAYVQKESADLENADPSRLVFVRTALVADAQYWLWSYAEADGEDLFVTCRVDSDGATLGLASPNGLSPEQFILAEYYDEVYWS
jgi:hypothetical protein